jgi:hypothetical protein
MPMCNRLKELGMVDSCLRSMRTASLRLVPLNTPRPSLLDVWARYRFHARTLAQMAGVPECIVLAMLYNQPVHRADAKKVLVHLSALLQRVYTLSTVAVVLMD